MAEYFVFCDRVLKHIRIHKAACGACKNGKGMHGGKIEAGRGDTYVWIPAPTYKEAHTIAEALPSAKNGGEVKDCGLCLRK